MDAKRTSLEDVLFEVWEECPKPKKQIAAEMNVPASTLSREISPYDTGAKFGAGALIPFMLSTDSLAPLEYLADFMGYRLVLKSSAPDTNELPLEILQGYDAAARFLSAAQDPEISPLCLAQLRRFADKEFDDVCEVHRDSEKGEAQ